MFARKHRQLPAILSADEVARFFAAVPSLKHRTALMTAYAAGLRVSEVVRLKLADIDSSRMLIRVEQGKGGRDRYIMLSPQLLVARRAARLLAGSTAGALAISGAGREPTARRERVAVGVPKRSWWQGSASRSPSIRCAAASPPIYSKPAPTS